MAPSIERDDAVFLDFDGTLADIAPAPGQVKVERGLPQLLDRVSARLGGAIAVVSGRPLVDLARLLYPFEGPAAGIHGLERRTARGEIIRPEPDATIGGARSLLAGFVAATPGVVLEDKGLALSLHFRCRPEQASACLRTAREAARLSRNRLVVMQGKMVVELHPRAAGKGRAIARFLEEEPFKGRRPVFAGDDCTDEDGFAVVNRLGGVSIRVGSGGDTAALFQFSGVPAVMAWLSAFAAPSAAASRPVADAP